MCIRDQYVFVSNRTHPRTENIPGERTNSNKHHKQNKQNTTYTKQHNKNKIRKQTKKSLRHNLKHIQLNEKHYTPHGNTQNKQEQKTASKTKSIKANQRKEEDNAYFSLEEFRGRKQDNAFFLSLRS